MIVPQFWAEARALAALQRLVDGERLPRRKPKIGHNGAEGVPIREEIVDRHGDAVVTRNAYGARCCWVCSQRWSSAGPACGRWPRQA